MLPTFWTYQLGKIIKEQRKFQNLTQQELANKIDVNKNTVYRLENGENVNIFVLFKTLDYFGMAENFVQVISEINNVDFSNDSDEFKITKD